ncbi:ParB-like nuclease domain protein [Rhodovulum sp. P5]|uniref:ParB/RepB/Spo0J family partition protein n=1 Tax=Rhodovulum sp. P5 TaxID=1564506 RepID=UPI0009C23A18|nr:ParB N-terminal domain-containing protein [Rhodovulum sp. P5]ARE40876.1 ParB-like nuclease domain protein [Rhodovulum sp. P5]
MSGAGKVISAPVDRIDVPGNRARAYSAETAQALAGVIEAQGLLHPITIRRDGPRFRLVAGLHRLRAFEILGRETIPARLSTAETEEAERLEELMENLGRGELIALDRCQHLFELKVVWERMHPETAHGKASPKTQSLRLSDEAPEVFGFAPSVAETVGLSKRSIQLAVKIWAGLSVASRKRLIGTDLAKKQTELKALSELKPAQQAKVLDLILGELPPANVAQALEYLETGCAPDVVEKRFHAVSRSIAALDDDVFDRVIAAHEDRVIASLRRQGGL